MTPVELRGHLEELGSRLSIDAGVLAIAPGLIGIPAELEPEIARHRHALRSHVRLFPCPGCGRDAFAGKTKCRPCPQRSKAAGARARAR